MEHRQLAGDPAVIAAIFEFLGIPLPAETAPSGEAGALVLYLAGPAAARLADPAGRTLSTAAAGRAEQPAAGSGETAIPGGQVLSAPRDAFAYLLIPDPQAGRYRVEVTGQGSGAYALGLLDTFGEAGESYAGLWEAWDQVRSQIEPATLVGFTVAYDPALGTGQLLAETPLIQLPLLAGERAVAGRALPGSAVTIRAERDDAVLGAGAAGEDGRFTILLDRPLRLSERVSPEAGGVEGVAVTAKPRQVFLPGVRR
jgi:hypothetical protein